MVVKLCRLPPVGEERLAKLSPCSLTFLLRVRYDLDLIDTAWLLLAGNPLRVPDAARSALGGVVR